MNIRRLQGSERFDAFLISAYCFHSRLDDPETERARAERQTFEDWGAFADDGTLMARIINNKFDFYIDGRVVRAGGIGAVSTLPEYRDRGAIREIFRALLPEARRSGEVISTLYPFKHEFYRKQGYEVITHRNDYEFSPAVLAGYRFDGAVARWNPGDPVDGYLHVYNRFARRFNLAALRDAEGMAEHMKVERLYRDRRFSYLLSSGKEPIAYVTFTDVRNDPAAILRVEECAWTGRDGFHAILGFLARFDADYGTIQLPLAQGIDLMRIIQSPRAYEIKKTCRHDFMARVIDAQKLLEAVARPSGCNFTIGVSDELIAENNGVWRVTANAVQRLPDDTASTPDIAVSERALAQLALGGVNLDEAMLRADVAVNANEESLRRVFVEKKIFVGEHF